MANKMSDEFSSKLIALMVEHGFENFLIAGVGDDEGVGMCMCNVPDFNKAMTAITLLFYSNPSLFEALQTMMIHQLHESVTEKMGGDGPASPVDPKFTASGTLH